MIIFDFEIIFSRSLNAGLRPTLGPNYLPILYKIMGTAG